ncbi:MAG: Lrp/AsnC family transcriptional regulator [Desulfobacteraceae bacterium]|nr:MAG: Lrp/AsnC family transcriptional regulator [Desulfobacteraceae bacterium]
MKLDKTNIAILKELRDGRKSFKEIAEKTAISENTARSRVTKLIEMGVLTITGLVNPELIPGHNVVMAGIKLNNMDLLSKGKEFSKIRGVVSVSVVTGRFDLILTVLLNENYGLLEFLTGGVAKIEEVQSVETFVVYKNYNLGVPYIL